MSPGFGKLAKVYGIITYTLSPFEQKAWKGVISKGVPNVIRRTLSSAPTVLPPFIIGYIVYEWTEREFHHLQRKNPADFENDK